MVVVLVSLLLASRALAVVPMALLHNIWGEVKLSPRDLVIIWCAYMGAPPFHTGIA